MIKRKQNYGTYNPSLLYEPRALWQIFRADAQGVTLVNSDATRAIYSLSKEFFKNASRYPMMITRMAIAPVGYFVRTKSYAATALATQNAALNGLFNVRVSLPYRQTIPKRFLASTALRPRQNGIASMHHSRPTASALMGLAHMQFDWPYNMPTGGGLQFDLMPAQVPGTIADDMNDDEVIPFVSTTMWHEHYDSKFGGSARVRDPHYHQFAVAAPGAAPYLAGQFYPANPFSTPFSTMFGAETIIAPPDTAAFPSQQAAANQLLFGGGNPIPAFAALATANPWPGPGQFQSKEFKRQDSAQGLATSPITGVSVNIDQINYDDQVAAGDGIVLDVGSQSTSQLLNVGCRARTTDGGTNEWWWREGAPTGLILSDIVGAPVTVYDLPEPITLRGGYNLNVEVEVPATNMDDEELLTNLQMGVALIGHAIIEG